MPRRDVLVNLGHEETIVNFEWNVEMARVVCLVCWISNRGV